MTTARAPRLPVRPTTLALATAALALCAWSPPIDVEPPVFSNPLVSTNLYEPFEVGAVKVYAGFEDDQVVTHVEQFIPDTRAFLVGGVNVECHTMRELTFLDGALSEVSRNYTAEADDGTVYSFGELTDIYQDGVIVSHDGSWLVGGPASPGDPGDMPIVIAPAVLMPTDPQIGNEWKPEDIAPEENEIQILLAEHQDVTVPAGEYQDSILIEEFSNTPGTLVEHKWYAPGVGTVKTVARNGHLALIASSLGSPSGGAAHTADPGRR